MSPMEFERNWNEGFFTPWHISAIMHEIEENKRQMDKIKHDLPSESYRDGKLRKIVKVEDMFGGDMGKISEQINLGKL